MKMYLIPNTVGLLGRLLLARLLLHGLLGLFRALLSGLGLLRRHHLRTYKHYEPKAYGARSTREGSALQVKNVTTKFQPQQARFENSLLR